MIELCLKSGIGFCITSLVLSNYTKNQSAKANFELTTRATLKKWMLVNEKPFKYKCSETG